MQQEGLDRCFNRLVEKQVHQIVHPPKQQGQTLEMRLQTLERFYQEGLMGDLTLGPISPSGDTSRLALSTKAILV